jgi:hypothetical protein
MTQDVVGVHVTVDFVVIDELRKFLWKLLRAVRVDFRIPAGDEEN